MTREITDADQVVWSCAQAYAGLGDTPAAQAAAKRAAHTAGAVVVVCTPAGGEQSVRLELPIDWAAALSDAALAAAIEQGRAPQ